MAAIRTVKDLSTNPDFSGYYDIEEAHKWDLKDMHLTGVLEGKVEGAKEANIETAKNLLNLGLDSISLEQIAECTGLSLEKVNLNKNILLFFS